MIWTKKKPFVRVLGMKWSSFFFKRDRVEVRLWRCHESSVLACMEGYVARAPCVRYNFRPVGRATISPPNIFVPEQ